MAKAQELNERELAWYIDEHKAEYRLHAKVIEPNRADWEQVWDRVAFAILTANAPFAASVKALAYATTCKGHCDPERLTANTAGMTPAKAAYVNALPLGQSIFALLKGDGETWLTYRDRLRKTVKGLGMAKASFAASLLYPLDADLACIDTWMQKVYMGHAGFKDLRIADYLSVEDKVRKLATSHGVNTFLAQWMVWDQARGNMTSHDIFPSGGGGK